MRISLASEMNAAKFCSIFSPPLRTLLTLATTADNSQGQLNPRDSRLSVARQNCFRILNVLDISLD